MKKIRLKKILKESNAPGYKDRKFGAPLPTLEDIQQAYAAKKEDLKMDGKDVEETEDIEESTNLTDIKEAAPKMKSSKHDKTLAELYKQLGYVENQVKAYDSSAHSHTKKEFVKAYKAIAELKSKLRRHEKNY